MDHPPRKPAKPVAVNKGRCGPTLNAEIAYARFFPTRQARINLAKPNYAFEKRQRDLAKKQKNEAKRQRKSQAPQATPDAIAEQPPPKTPRPEEVP